MAGYILSCCSTADLKAAHFKARDIQWIPFHFLLDGVTHDDDQTMSSESFYNAMRNGADTKTAQVSTGEFIEYFTPFLEQGKDILHISLSSGLSGVYNAACIARDDLRERFPERKIYVVDSLGASSGYGLIMETLADLRDGGMDIDELYGWIEQHKLEMWHWFFSTDLTFYVKGGRLSKVGGWFGTVLRICPILNMNETGHLTPRMKMRGKAKAIEGIVDRMAETARDGLNYSGKCFISQSDCLEDAQAVAKLVEERFPKLSGRVLINDIGTTIGSHTGPGTVALFFWGKSRAEA
ncbi:MAG: DegV family protein [Eubacteriales bacterium]|nr:DegV family protein [Eubacteriales bacterium]MDY5014989.1 DegV family protein [Eubacteriales bacterium]